MEMHNMSPQLHEVTQGTAVFSDELPIWLAKFGDNTWPFIEKSSPLYRGANGSSINWAKYMGEANYFNSDHIRYEYCLSPEIICDLKIASVIHYKFPRLLKHSRTTKGSIDPVTVKGRIEELAKFFSQVMVYLKDHESLDIRTLSEITLSAVLACIPRYSGRSSHLKRALKLISDPYVQKNLERPLQWTIQDLNSRSISWAECNDYGGIPTLRDSQFVFLMNTCRRLIGEFKYVCGMELLDEEAGAESRGVMKSTFPDFRDAFNYYYETGNRKGSSFQKKFGYGVKPFSGFIKAAHNAAMLVILLLTGMRESETKFLHRKCLNERHGYSFLDSKVIKQKPKDAPICEGWLATDIVIDAYDILMLITSKTGSDYLLSSAFPKHSEKSPTGFTLGVLNKKFNRWFQEIDELGLFEDWVFSVHQCRETLVYQLAKHEVGLPFISMHLKHFYSRFNRMPNEVTAGYGEYRKSLLSGIERRKVDARESVLLEVYGENKPFAGGAADAHKQRIDAFFSGAGLFGEDRNRYISKMAAQGVKLMPTSIGACTHNFIHPSDEDAKPPCYGDYQCDPDCPNHIITEGCGHVLQERKKDALQRAKREVIENQAKVWLGLAGKIDRHLAKLSGNNGVKNG